MIAQASESVCQILCAPALQIGVYGLRQGHADVRLSHQVMVERLDRGQAKEKSAGSLNPLLEAFQTVLVRAGREQPGHNYLGRWQQPPQNGVDRLAVLGPADVSGLKIGKTGGQQPTRPFQCQQLRIRLAEE